MKNKIDLNFLFFWKKMACDIDENFLLERIVDKVLPLSIKRICEHKNIEFEEKFLQIDKVTKKCIENLYKNYVSILLKCKNFKEVLYFLDIEKVSDLDCKDKFSSMQEMYDMINKITNKKENEDIVLAKYFAIIWGFLPIFQDVLYSKNLELPITMPPYFHSFNMVYNTHKVYEEFQKNENLEEFVNIEIHDNKNMLFKKKFFIECSTLEGMYTFAYFYNKYNSPKKELKFKFENEFIDIKNYIENKKYLLLTNGDNLPLYTSYIDPYGIIVNFDNIMFVQGFNSLSEIVNSKMIIHEDKIFENVNHASYIKT